MATKKNTKPRAAGEDKFGRTALHYACADLAANEVQRLIDGGANPNARDDNGWSPLHFAAQADSAAIAKLLLAAGAQIDEADSNGNTPLSNAVFSYRGDGAAIQLLRSSGADPNLHNNYGVSPVALA
ncbi:MAG: ankyrin repeat domain-containing protein [Rhodoferax sp.]